MPAKEYPSLPRPGSFKRSEQAPYHVVEEPEQVLRLVRSADGERQHHHRYLGALGKKLRGLRTVVRRVDYQLRRLALHLIEQLGEMRRRRRNSRLRLQARDLAHPRPVDEVRERLVVHDDRNTLERRGFFLPPR